MEKRKEFGIFSKVRPKVTSRQKQVCSLFISKRNENKVKQSYVPIFIAIIAIVEKIIEITQMSTNLWTKKVACPHNRLLFYNKRHDACETMMNF